MNERRHLSSFETPPKKVSPDEIVNIKKAELLEIICSRAIEVKNQLVAAGVKPETMIGVALDLARDQIIQTHKCWVVTRHPTPHYTYGNYGIKASATYVRTTGYALTEAGLLIAYQTDKPIDINSGLIHIPGIQSGEIVTEGTDPEVYLDNGILHGLDELSDKAKTTDK